MEHDDATTRALIEHAVVDEPGITQSRLCAITGRAWGTVAYHVKVLKRRSRIQTIKVGRELRVYPPTLPAEQWYLVSVVSDGARSGVLQYLNDNPRSCLADISREVGLSRKVVGRQLELLAGHGLLESDGEYQRRYWLRADADLEELNGAVVRGDGGPGSIDSPA